MGRKEVGNHSCQYFRHLRNRGGGIRGKGPIFFFTKSWTWLLIVSAKTDLDQFLLLEAVMSTTGQLYHNQYLRQVLFLGEFWQHGNYYINCQLKPKFILCPVCGSKNCALNSSMTRDFLGLPEGTRKTIIRCKIQRVKCRDCGANQYVKVPFADPHKRYTRKFAELVCNEINESSISSVSTKLSVSFDLCYYIYLDYLQKKYSNPDLRNLKFLVMDEIAVSKGHKYVTIVVNYVNGNVLYVGDGKGTDALENFWKLIGPIRAKKIKAVAIDMSPAFISAVNKNLPNAKIVFDHYHLVKLLNEHLDDLRREAYKEALNEEKNILKGKRWLLLKNPENLDGSKNETEQLAKILELNKPLTTGYYMKEAIRNIWTKETRDEAHQVLLHWVKIGMASPDAIINKMASTIYNFSYGILNWFDFEMTTSPLEGLNNKIKTIKRRSYGIKNQNYFRLRILGVHDTEFILTGIGS